MTTRDTAMEWSINHTMGQGWGKAEGELLIIDTSGSKSADNSQPQILVINTQPGERKSAGGN